MEKVTIRSISPNQLTKSDFNRLNVVSQDLWAHWIWEFVQCDCCRKMMSKKDIFWHLAKEMYDRTVSDIIKILWINSIPCIDCAKTTSFVYWEWHVNNIQERLLTKPSHLVVAQDSRGEIVWYMDWYVDSVDWIFNREYYSHYKDIWVWEIKNRVIQAIWYLPNEMLVFSWIWLIERHSNFFNIFYLLKHFFETISTIDVNTPAIWELDKNNHIYRLFNIIWYLSLWINDDEKLRNLIINKSDEYISEMVVHPNPIAVIKEKFCVWIKEILKIWRTQEIDLALT